MGRFDPEAQAEPNVSLDSTEEERRRLLAAGTPLIFPPSSDRPVVRAEWIHDLVDEAGTVKQPLWIANATIEGALAMPNVEFAAPVGFLACTFNDPVNLRGAVFKNLFTVEDSEFSGPVRADEVRVHQSLFLYHARFNDVFSLIDAYVAQTLNASGACFTRAAFIRMHVEKAVFFMPVRIDDVVVPTRFEEDVVFKDARFDVTADFEGAEFMKDADFSRLKVGGWLHVRDADAAFVNALQSVSLPAERSFSAIFHGPAIFTDASVGGADFDKTQFLGTAAFQRLSVASDAIFARTVFEDDSSFFGASVTGDMRFAQARFVKWCVMDRLTVGGALDLQEVRVPRLGLTRARIGRLQLRDEDDPTAESEADIGSVDLAAAQFESVVGDATRLLQRTNPFSRDPYDQVRAHLRAAGYDRAAADVYYTRRRRESALHSAAYRDDLRHARLRKAFGGTPRILFELFEWLIAGYGVRYLGLVTLSLAFLIAGSFLFARPGAVEPKITGARARQLRRAEAAAFSFATFVPVVQLPPAERWRPSDNVIRIRGYRTVPAISYETFAILERLFGFLLVPLGVAIVTGVLYRRDR